MNTQTEIPSDLLIPSGSVPYNEVTGADYSVGNMLDLFTAQLENDYTTGQWAGYKQWKEIGRQVSRGQKSTKVCLLINDKKKPGKKKMIFLSVFNVDQTEAVS